MPQQGRSRLLLTGRSGKKVKLSTRGHFEAPVMSSKKHDFRERETRKDAPI